MKKLASRYQIFKNTSGQDFCEYALIAGLLAVTAGAFLPGASSSIGSIFSEVGIVMNGAAGQGPSSGEGLSGTSAASSSNQ